MIRMQQVSKTFDHGQTFAVQEVNLEVADGETLVLLGTSGCGKTTTLKMINRLVEPSSGIIEVDGRNVMDCPLQKLRRNIGYAFQGVGLFPHFTVGENITIGLRLDGRPKKERLARAREMLALVALEEEFIDRYPHQLSGGQQQRVGVARALAGAPKNLLMDEPFGALDAITRDTLQKEYLKLQRELNKTVIFVTHDIIEALTVADRIAVMHAGRIEQVGSKTEILQQPATDFVRHLFAKPAEQLRDYWEAMHE
ncbi:ABC transporter ATP-binding protein [Desulfurivibrio dismutans]|uniref:ABC transporter ATP-binding protein n=1 Tax=Desulfurivibrio dismutans TaxID=1398908 RepID=UPI0023DAC35D|nr:ATP-binding cassette domain-containing protein [Desulfurivibrio alkaliphilus]MDF1615217.1 ATP-binding cassette domain-containing protein [Desulfurivibrio alkaliphilus]